ncbi:MAG: LysM peptidoglycan-binding domain-containing protein [Planctomycetota bacterium]
MNKNVIFGLVGVAVFAVIFMVMWEKGGEEEEPAFEPKPPAEKGENEGEKKGEAKGETKKPAKPDKPLAPKDPTAGSGETKKPDLPGKPETPGGDPASGGDTEKPKEIEKPKEPGKKPLEKTRITADPDAVDEDTKVAAAGHLERPMLLKEEEAVEGAGDEKKYPDSFTTEKTMSLYRVAEIVYGDAEKWQLLFEANKSILEDPEKVESGTRLTVPDPESPAAKSEKTKKKTSLTDGLF